MPLPLPLAYAGPEPHVSDRAGQAFWAFDQLQRAVEAARRLAKDFGDHPWLRRFTELLQETQPRVPLPNNVSLSFRFEERRRGRHGKKKRCRRTPERMQGVPLDSVLHELAMTQARAALQARDVPALQAMAAAWGYIQGELDPELDMCMHYTAREWATHTCRRSRFNYVYFNKRGQQACDGGERRRASGSSRSGGRRSGQGSSKGSASSRAPAEAAGSADKVVASHTPDETTVQASVTHPKEAPEASDEGPDVNLIKEPEVEVAVKEEAESVVVASSEATVDACSEADNMLKIITSLEATVAEAPAEEVTMEVGVEAEEALAEALPAPPRPDCSSQSVVEAPAPQDDTVSTSVKAEDEVEATAVSTSDADVKAETYLDVVCSDAVKPEADPALDASVDSGVSSIN